MVYPHRYNNNNYFSLPTALLRSSTTKGITMNIKDNLGEDFMTDGRNLQLSH